MTAKRQIRFWHLGAMIALVAFAASILSFDYIQDSLNWTERKERSLNWNNDNPISGTWKIQYGASQFKSFGYPAVIASEMEIIRSSGESTFVGFFGDQREWRSYSPDAPNLIWRNEGRLEGKLISPDRIQFTVIIWPRKSTGDYPPHGWLSFNGRIHRDHNGAITAKGKYDMFINGEGPASSFAKKTGKNEWRDEVWTAQFVQTE